MSTEAEMPGTDSTTSIDLLNDEETRTLVVRTLDEDPRIEADWIEVEVEDGRVTLSGRLGSEVEVGSAEALVRDTLGIDDFTSELVVDELHRGIAPEDPIEADAARDAAISRIGEPDPNRSDTAAHLADEGEGELKAEVERDEVLGTRDVKEAVESAEPFDPADRPVR